MPTTSLPEPVQPEPVAAEPVSVAAESALPMPEPEPISVAAESALPEPEPASVAAEPALPVPVPASVAAEPAPPVPELTPAECAQRLKALFPALFGGAPKPLKLRIQTDIQQRAPGQFTRRALSGFLHRHTGSTAYLMAITRLGQRFDLDAVAVDAISDEHRQAAVAELERRRASHDARRALEEEQRHNRAGLLRNFQTTTLTRANFCALKGVATEALDELLDLARREAEEAAQRNAGFDRPRRPPERRRRAPG